MICNRCKFVCEIDLKKVYFCERHFETFYCPRFLFIEEKIGTSFKLSEFRYLKLVFKEYREIFLKASKSAVNLKILNKCELDRLMNL